MEAVGQSLQAVVELPEWSDGELFDEMRGRLIHWVEGYSVLKLFESNLETS
jgi:hypothetical protein